MKQQKTTLVNKMAFEGPGESQPASTSQQDADELIIAENK